MARSIPHRFLWTFMTLVLLAPQVQAEQWPSWRGPLGNGISSDTNVTLHWDN
ncbi:MAG: hypothetical protein ABGX07_19675 [Pirellulaceae bacterium]